MANYAGELIRITMTAEDFDSTALTDADVDSMKVEIFDSTGASIVSETDMTYSSEEALWYYLWLTTTDGVTTVDLGGTALDAGSYRAKCKVIDLDSHPSWEILKIKLTATPV